MLQNLYKLKALGFEYIDPIVINEHNSLEKPNSFRELCANIASCHLCDLSKSRTQSMVGYGNPDADLMIVDYAVSLSDDASNGYYTGRSGETLKNMIENVIGLSVNDVFISHAIKCKPLGSSRPSEAEWNSCKSHLYSQIEMIKPKVIVTLGQEAYAKFSDNENEFEKVRGHVCDFKNYKLIPIYHPNFLLRNPELKKITMSDLLTIKRCL